MATQVEVFIDDEIESETPDELELRRNACERLGLAKQVTIPTRSPRQTTQEEIVVYRALFPRSVRLEDFESEAIPLRVLDVIESAKSSARFDTFQVWCPEEAKVSDPVLVGITTRKNPGGWNETAYTLLARWGSSLDEWPAMLKQARKTLEAKVKREASELLAKAKANVEIVSALVESEDVVRLSRHSNYLTV